MMDASGSMPARCFVPSADVYGRLLAVCVVKSALGGVWWPCGGFELCI